MCSRINAFALLIALLFPLNSLAGGLLRDAEIEATLRSYASPIFETAGIPPEDVRILIVDDPSVNAYVAGGLNMFLHTGLIKATNKPSMLIGVMAHETGHISGAHLSQLREKATRATMGSLIGAVLGAATIVGGAGEAGAGIISGSQNVALRQFLTGIRVNEQSADQAALTFLDSLGISASGMLEMFELLRRNERGARQDPYLLTHPLTQERVATMRNHVQRSSIPKDAVPKEFIPAHALMLAKLIGFTEEYDAVLRRYPVSDTSDAGNYARAIAEFRRNHLDTAIAGMQALIAKYPKNGFFYDTIGQIYFENGKLDDAEKAYAQAHALLPDSALIATDYAKTLIAQDIPGKLPQAIQLLQASAVIEDANSFTWNQLAIAYGRQGNLGESYLALAKESASNGAHEEVIQHVTRARGLLPKDSPSLLEADDLERDAKEQIRKQTEAESIF